MGPRQSLLVAIIEYILTLDHQLFIGKLHLGVGLRNLELAVLLKLIVHMFIGTKSINIEASHPRLVSDSARWLTMTGDPADTQGHWF